MVKEMAASGLEGSIDGGLSGIKCETGDNAR